MNACGSPVTGYECETEASCETEPRFEAERSCESETSSEKGRDEDVSFRCQDSSLSEDPVPHLNSFRHGHLENAGHSHVERLKYVRGMAR